MSHRTVGFVAQSLASARADAVVELRPGLRRGRVKSEYCGVGGGPYPGRCVTRSASGPRGGSSSDARDANDVKDAVPRSGRASRAAAEPKNTRSDASERNIAGWRERATARAEVSEGRAKRRRLGDDVGSRRASSF